MLDVVVEQAIGLWHDVGVDKQDLAALNKADIYIEDLSDGILGLASFGLTIYLDVDAAGFGWFIDMTHQGHGDFSEVSAGEFHADETSDAFGRIDLLTTVVHELGHILGLPDLDPRQHPNNVMSGILELGVRRLPGLENLTTQWTDGVSPVDVLHVDNHVSEVVTITPANDLTHGARSYLVALVASRGLDHTMLLYPLSVKDSEGDRQKNYSFHRLSTTATGIVDDNRSHEISRYVGLAVTLVWRDHDDDSLDGLAFGEYEGGVFISLLEWEVADVLDNALKFPGERISR